MHENLGRDTYTTFSLWDTYRAAMPLMTVLHPERMPDIIQTMLHIADEQGRLPVWHLWGNETDCMVGNPGIVAVADAIVKGIGGFDREKAFEAIRKTAMNPDRGNGLRMEYGYIPCEMFNEAVAYDMEYALADGAAARAAETLGKAEDAKYFEERSHSYRNYFDPATRFMRGRDSREGLEDALQCVRLDAPRRRLLRGQRLAVHLAGSARCQGPRRAVRLACEDD